MLKFNNKRDVDRHVSQMTKNMTENEVKFDLKAVRLPCVFFEEVSFYWRFKAY